MNFSPRTKGQASQVDIYVGSRLFKFRRLSGISQKELAKQISMNFQQIQKYEKGVNRISAQKLYEFSKILGVKVDDFFDGYESLSKNKIGQLLERVPEDFYYMLNLLNEIIDKNDRIAAIKNMILVLKIFKEKQER